MQYYTDRPENARIEDGCLLIQARRESFGSLQCTSARLKTQGLFSCAYGKIEARLKMPRGQGVWPALWMLGENIQAAGWPGCGEIDIVENIGSEPTTIFGTVHGPEYSGTGGITSRYGNPIGLPFADDYHVYRVHWTTGSVSLTVDGMSYFRVTPKDPPAGEPLGVRSSVLYSCESRN